MVMSILSLILFSNLFLQNDDSVTLYNQETLRGQVKCIVYDGQWQSDSIIFSYDKDLTLIGYSTFKDGKPDGYCEYRYSGENRIDQYHYDNNGKAQAHCIMETDERKNITLVREYGYIYPDTTRMILLYLRCNSYNSENQIESAFEYFCDGSPSYRYQYSYDSDGRTQKRINASTGNIYTVTRTTDDKFRNTVKVSETMPEDSAEWHSATIGYEYDSNGNWTKRKVNDCDPRLMNTIADATRRIYYMDK